MFEQFTANAIKVIILAQEESKRIGHGWVGTEQLLLGAIGEGTGRGSQVLRERGVQLVDARREVEQIIGKRGRKLFASELPFTPKAKAALEAAYHLAREQAYPFISSEHLLLGVLSLDSCTASAVLDGLGVDRAKMHSELEDMCRSSPSVEMTEAERIAKAPRIEPRQVVLGVFCLSTLLVLIMLSAAYLFWVH